MLWVQQQMLNIVYMEDTLTELMKMIPLQFILIMIILIKQTLILCLNNMF